MDKKSLLEWYADAGVDEAIGDEPINWLIAPPPQLAPAPAPKATAQATGRPVAAANNPLVHSPAAAIATARVLADQCNSIEELKKTVMEFEGCALKKTASKTVFSDGNPQGSLMIIGEAPGAQEDIQGIPFCGSSGALLDKMLASIGLDRTRAYISNTVFWRPPGNRQPTPEETEICLPFVEKHIALVNPKLLMLSGGVATTTLLRKDASISRLRGRLYEYSNAYTPTPIPTILTYHPSYLLRSPQQKRLAWEDMLTIKKHLGL